MGSPGPARGACLPHAAPVLGCPCCPHSDRCLLWGVPLQSSWAPRARPLLRVGPLLSRPVSGGPGGGRSAVLQGAGTQLGRERCCPCCCEARSRFSVLLTPWEPAGAVQGTGRCVCPRPVSSNRFPITGFLRKVLTCLVSEAGLHGLWDPDSSSPSLLGPLPHPPAVHPPWAPALTSCCLA